MIGKTVGHIIKKNESKYLVFDLIDENKEVFKKYTELWDGIKNEIETINGSEVGEYDKDFMKIKFDTDDDLPLNKQLKLHVLTIAVRSVFQDEGNFCPQVYLGECLYELRIEYDRIDISEGIDVNKTNAAKECDICHY